MNDADGRSIESMSERRPMERRTLDLEKRIAMLEAGKRYLEERLERLYELTENLREVLWLIDWEHRELLYLSPGYEVGWGHSAEPLYDDLNNWLLAVHPEDRGRVAAAFDRKVEAGEFDEEYRIERSDGTVRWMRHRAVPIRGSDGEVVRVAGISEDITRRKEAEEDAAGYRDRLQTLLNERTLQLDEAQRVLGLSKGSKGEMIEELREALSKVRNLRELLPICATCRRVRDDGGYWHMVEEYIESHTESNMRYCICPECAAKRDEQLRKEFGEDV